LFVHVANNDYDDDVDDDGSDSNDNDNSRNCTTCRKKKDQSSTEMAKDTDGDHVASEDSQKDAKSDAEVILLNRYIILHMTMYQCVVLCDVADVVDDAVWSVSCHVVTVAHFNLVISFALSQSICSVLNQLVCEGF